MNSRLTAIAASISALIIVAAAAPSYATGGTHRTVDELLPMMSDSQQPIDLVPEAVRLGELGPIDVDTIRSLGSDGTASYWISRSEESGVCLIAHIAKGDAVSASTCGTLVDFDRRGMGIALGQGFDDTDASITAYLIPNDVDTSQLDDLSVSNTEGINEMHPMLISLDSAAVDFASLELPRTHGEPFTFRPLPSSVR